MLRQTSPTLVALALDEGLARFALGVQRIERLLQPILGGFAGVDGAALRPPAAARRRLVHDDSPAMVARDARFFTRKKRGPDQCTPVIRVAICVSER